MLPNDQICQVLHKQEVRGWVIESGRNEVAGCRVVSRGKLSSRASDFGGLEVFGQASIGNTDPYLVFKALKATLSQHS